MTATDAYTLQVNARYWRHDYALRHDLSGDGAQHDLRYAAPRHRPLLVYLLMFPASPCGWSAIPCGGSSSPHIESVVGLCYYSTGEALEALQTGEIDAFSTRSYTAAFNRRLSSVMTTDYSTASYEMLVPNLSASSPMSDQRVRQAVMYAIDRATLVSNAYLEMAQQSEVPIVPGTWLYESQSAVYYYSPERALQLLNEAVGQASPAPPSSPASARMA